MAKESTKKKNTRKKKLSKAKTKEINHSIKVSLIVLLVIVLFVLVFSFSLTPKETLKNLHIEKMLNENNNSIDEEAFKELTGQSCDEIREILGTNKQVCIYFKDENDRLIMLENGKYGVGCNGLKVKGNKIC